MLVGRLTREKYRTGVGSIAQVLPVLLLCEGQTKRCVHANQGNTLQVDNGMFLFLFGDLIFGAIESCIVIHPWTGMCGDRWERCSFHQE